MIEASAATNTSAQFSKRVISIPPVSPIVAEVALMSSFSFFEKTELRYNLVAELIVILRLELSLGEFAIIAQIVLNQTAWIRKSRTKKEKQSMVPFSSCGSLQVEGTK